MPQISAVEHARRTMLESVRPHLVKRISGVHIESLSVGGPEDPFEAVRGPGDLTALTSNAEWIACRWYVTGIAEALCIKFEDVIDVVRGHLPGCYPDPVMHYIEVRRRRRGLAPLRSPSEAARASGPSVNSAPNSARSEVLVG